MAYNTTRRVADQIRTGKNYSFEGLSARQVAALIRNHGNPKEVEPSHLSPRARADIKRIYE